MNSESLQLLQAEAEALGVRVSAEQLGLFDKFGDLLLKWSAKINLTALTTEREIVLGHFVDSLSIIRFLEQDFFWLDIGTGAGFPGIPGKLVFPQSKLLMLEKKEKKVAFLKEAIRSLGLLKTDALKQDADNAGFRSVLGGMLDLVVCRALAEPTAAFDICRHYPKPGGRLCLMLTAAQFSDRGSLKTYAGENGFREGEHFHYRYAGLSEERVVYLLVRD